MEASPLRERPEKYFPIHVLAVGAGDESGCEWALLCERLAAFPSVRAYGMTADESEAASWIRDEHVNTVFVNPASLDWNVGAFVERVRMDRSNVLAVLCGPGAELESWFQRDQRLRQCFPVQMPLAGDANLATGAAAGAGAFHARHDALAFTMSCCEQWHLDRHPYDICVSFAQADRTIAETLAGRLRDGGARVCFDDEEVSPAGADLFAYLHELYASRSRYLAILASRTYTTTRARPERLAAQTLALLERPGECVLAIRLDDDVDGGVPSGVKSIAIDKGIEHIADIIDGSLWIRGAELRRCIGTTPR
jgi:hypothetical protein